ncbi:MAG: Crp/Fnr family transcriptional regulator [Bacteroidetes bacterium]|nr:Crp/Fnr family transcriptional regulator [Bacteroidota bacterium]
MTTDFGDCMSCKSFSKSAFSCFERGSVSKLINGNSVSIHYKKGQEIYNEGALAKGVFCIQQGKAKVYKKCPDRNMTIGLAGNSDLLGYHALFNSGHYKNSAACLEDSHICFIPKKTFLNLMASNPDMFHYVMRHSSQENNRLSDMVRDLKCKNMLSRVARSLVTVSEKYGFDNAHCLNVTLTRKDIAELSGTTTASAIRILNDLKKEKVIGFHNKRIRIQDVNKLMRYNHAN